MSFWFFSKQAETRPPLLGGQSENRWIWISLTTMTKRSFLGHSSTSLTVDCVLFSGMGANAQDTPALKDHIACKEWSNAPPSQKQGSLKERFWGTEIVSSLWADLRREAFISFLFSVCVHAHVRAHVLFCFLKPLRVFTLILGKVCVSADAMQIFKKSLALASLPSLVKAWLKQLQMVFSAREENNFKWLREEPPHSETAHARSQLTWE